MNENISRMILEYKQWKKKYINGLKIHSNLYAGYLQNNVNTKIKNLFFFPIKNSHCQQNIILSYSITFHSDETW